MRSLSKPLTEWDTVSVVFYWPYSQNKEYPLEGPNLWVGRVIPKIRFPRTLYTMVNGVKLPAVLAGRYVDPDRHVYDDTSSKVIVHVCHIEKVTGFSGYFSTKCKYKHFFSKVSDNFVTFPGLQHEDRKEKFEEDGKYYILGKDYFPHPDKSEYPLSFYTDTAIITKGEICKRPLPKNPILRKAGLPRKGVRNNNREVLLQTISDTFWLLDIGRIPDMFMMELTYESLKSLWKKFCTDCMKQFLKAVGYKPDPRYYDLFWDLPPWKVQVLYSARRALPMNDEFVDEDDILPYLSSYREVRKDTFYKDEVLRNVTRALLEHEGQVRKDLWIPMQQSVKATLELTGPKGGVNACILTASNIECKETFLEEHMLHPAYSDDIKSLLSPASRNINTFRKALNFSLCYIHEVKKSEDIPRSFYKQIPERGKDRIPGVTEFCYGLVARYASGFLKSFMTKCFPDTYRGVEPDIKAQKYMRSGDMLGGTDNVNFRISKGIGRMLLARCIPDHPRREWFIEAVLECLGPHLIIWTSKAREELSTHFGPDKSRVPVVESTPVSMKKFAPCNSPLLVAEYKYLSGEVPIHNIIRKPSGYKYLSFEETMELRKAQKRPNDSFVSTQGLIMGYGLAQPILMILGKIPHYLLRIAKEGSTLSYSIIGDDNASSSDDKKEIMGLEKETKKTSMIPHELEKSFISKVGCILAERLMIKKKGEGKLVRVDFFPMRCLFPGTRKGNDFITMPSGAEDFLKNHSNEGFKKRVRIFLYKRNFYFYNYLRKHAIPFAVGNDPLLRLPQVDSSHFVRDYRNSLYKIKDNTTGDFAALASATKLFIAPEQTFATAAGYKTEKFKPAGNFAILTAYCQDPFSFERRIPTTSVSLKDVMDRFQLMNEPQTMNYRFEYSPGYSNSEQPIERNLGPIIKRERPRAQDIINDLVKWSLHPDNGSWKLRPQTNLIPALHGIQPLQGMDRFAVFRKPLFVDVGGFSKGALVWNRSRDIIDIFQRDNKFVNFFKNSEYESVILCMEKPDDDVCQWHNGKIWVTATPLKMGSADRLITYFVKFGILRGINLSTAIMMEDAKRIASMKAAWKKVSNPQETKWPGPISFASKLGEVKFLNFSGAEFRVDITKRTVPDGRIDTYSRGGTRFIKRRKGEVRDTRQILLRHITKEGRLSKTQMVEFDNWYSQIISPDAHQNFTNLENLRLYVLGCRPTKRKSLFKIVVDIDFRKPFDRKVKESWQKSKFG